MRRFVAPLLMLLVLAACAGRGRLPADDDVDAWGHELSARIAWPH